MAQAPDFRTTDLINTNSLLVRLGARSQHTLVVTSLNFPPGPPTEAVLIELVPHGTSEKWLKRVIEKSQFASSHTAYSSHRHTLCS